MVAKNLLLLSSMVFLLSACGGSESEETTNITAATSSDTINSNSQNVALPSSETIDLTDALATTSIAKLTASGSAVANLVSLNNDVTNAEASLSFSQTSEITQGNVTFLLAVSDEDGINNVDLVLANVNKSIALCNENCGSSFEKSVIGLSPYIYGEVSGSVRIEIWVTDLLNNTVLANTATLNWQPYSISGVTATRDTTSINLSWQENTNVNRYNVYLATEAGVLPNNIEQLNNGQQYLSLTDTDLIIDNVLSDESYQILITGVEGSGESAFSELINIAPLNGELSFSAQAITDNYQTNEDTPVNGNVLTNDINLYLGDLAVVLNTLVQPQYGTLEINELGDFTYTPAANFNGNDVFSYEVSNELGLTDTALVEITVAAINDNPVALNNSYTVNVDGYLLVDAPGLLANDSDIDLDTLSIDTTPVNQPTYGALTLFSDGGFEYQSTESIAINDSFQYRVTDLNGGEAVATVIINASDENTPPIAVNDSYALSEDVKLEVSLEQGLLSNDSDADDNSFTIDESFIISPSHGQLLLSNDGSFSYIPDANFFGVDEFQYQIIDTAGATATALVTLTISNVADNPTAQNDEYTFTQNKLLEISADNGLLINDINIESGSLSVNTNPIVDTQYGTLTLQTNGAFTYQPNTIEFYVDSFSYEIQNEFGLTATAQVVLSKSNENTYPIAVDDSYTIDEDSSNVTFNVLENDSDANGDTITIASIDHTLGEASIIDNQINFTPPSDFYGETTITYTLSDGYSAGINDTNDSTATVNIVVNNINDFPIANNDAITTNEDTAVIVNVTANDLDIDNDTLSVTAATADIGSVTIVDNQLSYMPPANTNGTATLSYTLSDGNEGVATGSLVVTIIAVNDAPIALADNITIEEDSASTLINVLANDLDIDNDALSITAATTDIGTVSIISNKLQYTPPADTHGTATITYAINDGNEGSATANVAVTINSVNDVPVAVNDTASMDEDAAPITIDVLANDTDIDNDALSITAASADIGTVSIISNKLQYTPPADTHGAATITYAINDGNEGSATASITVTINSVNDVPVAINDTASMDEDAAPITIDVLANDTDIDNDALSITAASADIGTVSLISNKLQYTPPANTHGNATITYAINDGNEGSATASVTVTINSVNDVPVAVNDTASMDEDAAPITIDVLANDTDIDNDALSITAGSADIGTVSLISNKLQYTPPANTHGNATITYAINDGNEGTATASVTVTINSVNDVPVAINDTASMDEDAAPITIDVLANDTDIDNDALSITAASADIGTVSIISNKLQYTPPANTHGNATISYTISDSNEGVATASVSITINSVNDAPTVTNDTATMDEDGATITIDVLANDSDIDGDTLNITAASADEGAVSVSSNTLRYTPSENKHGVVNLSYTVSDGNEGVATATVAVTINSVNDTPIAINDTAMMDEDDAAITIDVLANDTDVDGDTLLITSASAETGAIAVISNAFKYTAPKNYNGTVNLNYTVSDGNEGVATATVTVTINSVNDAPTAADQSFNVSETIVAGEIIGSIVASDIENNNLTFAVLDDSTDLLQLDSSTGVITASRNGGFDYETQTTHSFTISVTDDGTPNEVSTITITINVVDGDDPLLPLEDANFGRTITGQQDLSSAFMQSEFNDSIELNNNLYFVGHTNNTDQDIIIASYTNSGEFNINFNETGVKVLDFGGDESATAIISGDDDLFIAFTLNDGTSTEACLLKMDLSGTLSDDSGELDSGYLCTQYLTSTKINDLAFTDNKVQAVGQYDNGTDLDSLWIKYDKSTLAFESGPIVTDISGIQQDDASFAIKSFGLSELMIVGSTTTAQGDKSAVIRYLLPDGTNSPSFNSDSPMIIDLSSINQDDELLAIGGADADDFTALLGGYTTLDSGEQEAVLIAIDKNGDKTTAFGTEGIAIFDIDGNAGAGNGGTNITGVEYEPINNQVVLVGTTGIDHDEQVYSARINPTTGELDSNYANSGINIVSNINGKQSANAVSVDENDTLWISGALEDANTLPFITAIDKQAELVTDFSTLGYLTLTELHDPSDDAANTVLQLTHAEHAGKYLVAATAEFDNEIKLVLARYTETGEIDTNFSSHGQRTLDISLSHSDIAMVEDSNGDILIAGSRVTLANDEGFIVKLDQNGDLVSEFASDGIYGTSDTTSEQVSLVDIAIDSNNNTAAVGTVNIGGTARSFIVLLDDTGVRDHDFSNNGAVTGTQNLYYQRVHFNNNNEIIVAGKAVTGINASHFAIKYTENGGQAFYSSASQASLSVTNNITAILTDTSGNIYLIGNNGEDPTQAVVIKLLETGEVDTSFAVTGTGHYNLTASENTLISAAVLDSAGRIILAGQANNQGVLARIATDGTLDSGFGSSSSGYFESELCDGVHAFSSIHLLDDTQIVATNTCTGSISSDISLSKFNFYPDGVEP